MVWHLKKDHRVVFNTVSNVVSDYTRTLLTSGRVLDANREALSPSGQYLG